MGTIELCPNQHESWYTFGLDSSMRSAFRVECLMRKHGEPIQVNPTRDLEEKDGRLLDKTYAVKDLKNQTLHVSISRHGPNPHFSTALQDRITSRSSYCPKTCFLLPSFSCEPSFNLLLDLKDKLSETGSTQLRVERRVHYIYQGETGSKVTNIWTMFLKKKHQTIQSVPLGDTEYFTSLTCSLVRKGKVISTQVLTRPDTQLPFFKHTDLAPLNQGVHVTISCDSKRKLAKMTASQVNLSQHLIGVFDENNLFNDGGSPPALIDCKEAVEHLAEATKKRRTRPIRSHTISGFHKPELPATYVLLLNKNDKRSGQTVIEHEKTKKKTTRANRAYSQPEPLTSESDSDYDWTVFNNDSGSEDNLERSKERYAWEILLSKTRQEFHQCESRRLSQIPLTSPWTIVQQ